jgi:putative transposase
MTRLRHFDNLGTARFITFSTFQRRPLLNDETLIRIFLRELCSLRREHSIQILGYVIMPDHVHLVLHPPDSSALGRIIGQLKGRSSRQMLRAMEESALASPPLRTNGQPAIWQRRCYDHNCRTTDTVKEKINYCHNNPVTKGLVRDANDWTWSSYRWYHGEKCTPLEIDGFQT